VHLAIIARCCLHYGDWKL